MSVSDEVRMFNNESDDPFLPKFGAGLAGWPTESRCPSATFFKSVSVGG